MKISDAIQTFTEDLENFKTLINFCDTFKVPHDEDTWLDDDWVKHESDLRDKLAEAMERVGKK